MDKSSAVLKLASLVLLICLLMRFSLAGVEKISCATVLHDLDPCVHYVLHGGEVEPDCCKGTKTLVQIAKTKSDRQSVCSCLKDVASAATVDQIKRAAAILKICGVHIPINITRDVDCSKVQFV